MIVTYRVSGLMFWASPFYQWWLDRNAPAWRKYTV